MRIVSTGFPRCGSMSFTGFMRNLFPSFHEPCMYINNVNNWLDRRDIKAYDLNIMPNSVAYYCDFFPDNKIVKEKDSWFMASWDLGLVMYELAKRNPDIIWLVTLREPEAQISSLVNYAHDNIENITEKWLAYYFFLAKQIKRMDKKPYVLEFETLVRGGYNDFLFQIIRQRKPNLVWEKMNTSGKYQKKAIDFKCVCEALHDTIRGLCELPKMG